MFTYLAELHDKKVQSGQLGREAAVPTLPQIASSSSTAAAAAEASRPEGSTWAAAAAPSTALASEAVTAEVVPALGSAVKKPSWVQREPQPLGSGMPATVDLQPSKRRGKKSLKHKLGKAKAKLGISDGCSVM